MRTIQFIIFFSIVISVYGLFSFYLYSRGLQVFPVGYQARTYYKIIFIFLASSYIIGRFLERLWLSTASDIFMWIGSFWLAAFFYFLMIILVIDIVRLINLAIPVIPEFVKTMAFKKGIFWSAVGIVAIFLSAGFINSLIPKIKKLDITINKKVDGLKEPNIVFASDIHLGTIIGPRRTNSIVAKINNLNPDLILLGGDIVDEDLAPVIRNNLGDSLRKLNAPLGVFGITGNHEFIGGAERAVKYLEDHGVQMIRDTSVLVQDKIYIIGREDRDKKNFAGENREGIENLTLFPS